MGATHKWTFNYCEQVNEAYYSFNLILGERKSPYVAICCIAMAASILFW